MTEENKSVLKTKLGLENLKGLGDFLKQFKEVMGKAEEFQKMFGELAKENSPLNKALAGYIEAQGLKTLNEDNITVSEEVRKNMAEELKNREKTLEELEAENKGLKEDKVISEVTTKLTGELDKRLPQSGAGTDGSGSKLFKAIEDVVAKKLEQLLGGGGEGTLTSEQIRKVVKEEVTAVAGCNKKPEDMVDDLVNALSMGDKLREKLGVAGIGGRLLQENPGGNSGLRTDLVKLLLEDERERLRISQEHEVESERNKHIGTLAATVKENLGDGIAAISAAAREIKEGSGAGTPAESQPQTFECGDCHTKFSPPAGWEGQPLKCPNPACGREYTKEELLA